MSPSKGNLGRTDLVNGLKLIGLRPGDIVFFQVSHLTLGPLECGSFKKEVCELLYSAMREVIGPEGTMLLPAFSFSFYRNEDFDVEATPSIQGAWSSSLEFLEYFRRLPGVVRSADPILSVAGLGPRAENSSPDCQIPATERIACMNALLTPGGRSAASVSVSARHHFSTMLRRPWGCPSGTKSYSLDVSRIMANGANKDGFRACPSRPRMAFRMEPV